MCRHPELFQPPKAHSRLPSKSDIGIMVSERIGALGGLAVAADPMLNEAAGFPRLSKHDRVVLEKAPGKVSRVFVVCRSCPSFRVCRNTPTVAPLCECCQNKTKWTKQKSERREKNRDARVAPRSRAPWKSLTAVEVSTRAGHLKVERKSKATIIKRLRERIKTQSRVMVASDGVMKHINEALDYSLANKTALGATMEEGLLELLKEESEKSGLVGDYVLTKEETCQLVEYVSESMKNHIRLLGGQKIVFVTLRI